MSRARQVANFDPALFAADEISGDKVSGGTIGAGTWEGTDVAVAHGGTGASTHTANNVLIGAGTSAITSVAPGSDGNVLTSTGTVWQSEAAAGGVSYEEGTWTATLTAATPPSTPPTDSDAMYTKIGNVVTVQYVFAAANTTGGSGMMIVDGLPYIPVDGYAAGTFSWHGFTFTATDHIHSYVDTAGYLYWLRNISGLAWGTQSITAAGSVYLKGSCTYHTTGVAG